MQSQNQSLVEELKEFTAQERERIYNRHQFGIGGKEIVEEYTRLADNVIQRIFNAAIQEGILPEEPPLVILALGGYGRQALNPYSDIDIMVVYHQSKMRSKAVQPFANQLISTLWDVGFDVGHSCRSIKECIRATYQDIFSKTSMIDARYIAGERQVHRQFQRQTSKHVFKKQVGSFIAKTIQDWSDRHEEYGATIYLQEPNIKESAGGLRDFHTAIWVAAVRYGVKELQGLWKRGIIPQSVANECEESLDFLWRLRNELHYLTKRRSDQLTFELQEQMAKNLGYTDRENILAEEFMMRDYYLHAEDIYEFTKLIVDRVKYRGSRVSLLIDRLKSTKLPDGFMVMRDEICFQLGHSGFAMSPRRLMKVFVHRQQLGHRIGADVRHQIAESLDLINDGFRRSKYNSDNFMSILRHPERVAETLRRMHRWHVLDRYMPEFGKIRSLVRYDRPHQYTVDEHTMYALENLEEATLAGLKDGQAFLEILETIEKPELLRLAVLLHDVGKGIEGPGDHDERGVEAAKEVLDRLGLDEADREVVLFLISKHLDMGYTSRQRDIDDPKVIERFADVVKDEQHLKMLYLLTFADMRAVSPELWTQWNAILLWKLYNQTLKFLQGKTDRVRLDELRKQVTALIGDTTDEAAIQQHFETMPEQELISNPPELLSKQIQLIEQLGEQQIIVSCFSEEETHTQIAICTRDARGIFRRITGVLAAEHLNILSADIDTRTDGIVIDILNITDGQTGKGTVWTQCHQVAEMLTAVWSDEVDVESLLAKREKSSFPAHVHRRNVQPEIRIDNDASDNATIIDIRAPDRVGFLYTIADAFYELGLDIRLAKITTSAFTAVDSFYVTDAESAKITCPIRMKEIQQVLAERLGAD